VKNILIKDIVQQLKNIQNGQNWLEENFEEKINSVTHNRVFERPIPEIKSVAELVYHSLIWRTESTKKLKGLKSELTMQSSINWKNNNELKKLESTSSTSALATGFLTTAPPGKPTGHGR